MAELLKYPLMGKGNCTRDEIVEFLRTTEKPILYTFGLKYRDPTTRDVEISNKRAVELFNTHFSDVEEKEEYVDLNCFSSNDLY